MRRIAHFASHPCGPLAAAFAITAWVKLRALTAHSPANLLAAWSSALLDDLAFFGAAALALGAARRWCRNGVIARLAMAAALLVLGWTVLNTAWLLHTGAQLQPPVLRLMAAYPGEFWPLVAGRLARRPALAVAAAAGTVAALGLAVLLVSAARPAGPHRHRRYGLLAAALAAVAALLARSQLPRSGVTPQEQLLTFSSHAQALAFALPRRPAYVVPGRNMPRAGERRVGLPDRPAEDWPDIALLVLESVSYAASGLDHATTHAIATTQAPTSESSAAAATPMPAFARLAQEGALFANTRVPVSQTGKALWAMLSGTTPEICPDYSESLLVDVPYEGLPTLLRRVGYRSGSFQMTKGSFECGPAFFANFGFDWCWYRENLGDESAYLGYLAGDDFRMLDPACAWAAQDPAPYLLVLITSVAHDPFELPAWYGPPAADEAGRYVQSLRFTDDWLAAAYARLRGLGRRRDLLLCVIGDHGVSLRPGVLKRWMSYEEVVRVPWVLHWPGHVPAGLRVMSPVNQIDVGSTLLTVLGFDLATAGLEGGDALARQPASSRHYFSGWFEDSPIGYLEGNRKCFYWPTTGELRIIELAADPGEERPVTVLGPERDRVRRDVEAWMIASRVSLELNHFRERVLYRHWRAWCSGRYARAAYVP
ncbi:MAG: sulfatase-like hydrolase/transferase [Planctomycetota bacterium]